MWGSGDSGRKGDGRGGLKAWISAALVQVAFVKPPERTAKALPQEAYNKHGYPPLLAEEGF